MIHNRYVKTKKTKERLLLKKYTTHMKFKLLYSQTETRKRSILIKTGTKFYTKKQMRTCGAGARRFMHHFFK